MSSSITPEMTAPRYDFKDPSLFLQPHPFLHELRAEAPIHWSPQLDSWVLTRYHDVDQAFNDPRLSVVEETKRMDALPRASREALLPLRRSFEMWGGRSNVADHDRFQQLHRRHFTPSVAKGLRPGILSLASQFRRKWARVRADRSP